MKNPLWRKLLMIAGLTLLLCIPLRMTGVAVWERSAARESVKADIANSMAGAQRLAGPVLVLPYRQMVTREVKDGDGKMALKTFWEWRTHVWLPDTLNIDSGVVNTPRYRGIYKAQLYQNSLKINAAFNTARNAAPAGDGVEWGQPYLALGVSDVRGISEMPRGKMNDKALTFAADTGLPLLESGVHAPVSIGPDGHFEASIGLDLKGMERIDFLPVGRDTLVAMHSNWPHPSFQGRYLPDSQDINKDGFHARWRTTFLATNIEKQFADCLSNSGSCSTLMLNSMGVRLIDPVDVYLQSERGLKYGFLFVIMAFGAFFLYELLKGLKIHPVQYSLVGFSLTLFFLLLVALAEHVVFAMAYAIAAAGCTALLWFYVSYVLRSVLRGMGFAGLIALMFGALYGLLQSEDYALLMGALLLFGMLALIMILTRHLDWFALGEAAGPAPVKENSQA